MAANMKANMENPDFLIEKERRLQEARDEVLKKYKNLLEDTDAED